MANRMREGLEWNIKRMRERASSDVLYIVPNVGSETVPAIFASRTEDTESISGASIYVRKPDFLIAVEDLVINDEEIRPAHGHKIQVDGNTYEVTGTPSEDSGRFGLRWRIHTILIEVG